MAGQHRSDRVGTTREQLLASGRALVLEQFGEGAAPHRALAYLSPALVADHAGLSRGTIYHHWGAEDDEGAAERPFDRYCAEVAQLVWSESVAIDDIDLLASLLPDDVSEVILELAAFELERLTRGDDAAMFRASTAMALHGVDLSTQFRSSVDRLAEIYQVVMVRVGRRVLAPLTVRDLAQAVAALTAGFAVTELFDPGSGTRTVAWEPASPGCSSDREWTLFAVAAEAIMLQLTEPLPRV